MSKDFHIVFVSNAIDAHRAIRENPGMAYFVMGVAQSDLLAIDERDKQVAPIPYGMVMFAQYPFCFDAARYLPVLKEIHASSNSLMVIATLDFIGRVEMFEKAWKNFPDAPEYPRAPSTVDIVPLVLHEGQIKAAFTWRQKEPSSGKLALPGGFMHFDTDKSMDDAAIRIIQSTMPSMPEHYEQVETICLPNRDLRGPGGWSSTTVYLAVFGPDAGLTESSFFSYAELEGMYRPGALIAFDHRSLAMAALRRFSEKSYYTNLPTLLLGEQGFSMADVVKLYGVATGETFSRTSMTRKIEETEIFEQYKSAENRRGNPILLRRKRPGFINFGKEIIRKTM